MQPFAFVRPDNAALASEYWRDGDAFIAGGTDLLQLMKTNVAAPRRVVDLERLDLRRISVDGDGLELGALCSMAEVAGHHRVRTGFPVISQALLASASPQVRNMGTVGGNLLQRTRCNYFRDVGFACNKRVPGTGCPALHGENRELAIFGGSPQCIATHPSDFPVALMALDAEVELAGKGSSIRRLKLADFYRLPEDTPQIETAIQPGELITKVRVPTSPAARNSCYLKVRDRTSFAFALVSAAVGLDVSNGVVHDARVALGGVGPMPWRLPHVEAALRGQRLEPATLQQAATLAGDGATGAGGNDFKIDLARRTVLRALRTVAEREG
jgi:xanthine dehydrogenase YagS FAD-binding subunit